MTPRAWLGTVAVLAAAASACKVATVRRLDEKGSVPQQATSADAPFDAAKLVDSIWSTEVLPAVEAAEDAAALARRASAPGAGAVGGAVAVRGQGRVLEVDARSRSGTAKVELDGSGSIVLLQVGPVLTGTAIRDAFPSLGFDRFVNQIQHADVGNELNARVEQRVLRPLDRARLRGRRVSFAGVATLEAGRPIRVTPVRLEPEDRR